jgi:tetratricopeptide (TPR) repeat protein
MIRNLLIIFFILFLVPNFLNAKSIYFQDGIVLFNKNKFEEARFKFEQDIVYNPKNELSYLYLSKIFNKKKNNSLEEQNLNSVMLLNPKNEEAVYNLAKLKLSSSDYKKSIELNKKLKSLCIKLCDQSDKLRIEIENLSKK